MSLLDRLKTIHTMEKAYSGKGCYGGKIPINLSDRSAKQKRKYLDCPPGLTYQEFVKQCGGVQPKGSYQAYKNRKVLTRRVKPKITLTRKVKPKRKIVLKPKAPPKPTLREMPFFDAQIAPPVPRRPRLPPAKPPKPMSKKALEDEAIELIAYFGDGLVGGNLKKMVKICRKATKEDLQDLISEMYDNGLENVAPAMASVPAPPPPPPPASMMEPLPRIKIVKQPIREPKTELLTPATIQRNDLISELQAKIAARAQAIDADPKAVTEAMGTRGGRMRRRSPKSKSARLRKTCPKGMTSYQDFVKMCGGVPPKGSWAKYKRQMGMK